MQAETDAPRVWWVTRDMARINGTSLAQAVLEGALSREDLAAIITRCGLCPSPGRCHAWRIRAEVGAEEVAELPGFCPNKPAIEALTLP